MAIKKLETLIEMAKKKSKKRVVVAYGQDDATIHATKRAIELDFAEFILVGDKKVINKICVDHDIDPDIYTIIHEPDELRSGEKAIELSQKAIDLSPNDSVIYATLAASYAEAGRFEDAIIAQEKAIELSEGVDKPELLEKLNAYKNNKPWIDE